MIGNVKNSIGGLMSLTAKARSAFPLRSYWAACIPGVREAGPRSAGCGRRY